MTDGPLSDLLTEFFAPGRPARLGVAVSGGGDSMALLHLLADWRDAAGPILHAVTVDHGLRPEAAAEADMVAAACLHFGLAHDRLRWDGSQAIGNLPDAARRARYGLIADWARARALDMVALAHTADDQAETVLMRLARGSGVDGLSPMVARRRHLGVTWVRPLLQARRADLRRFLQDRGQGWADDPTNDDPAYDRVQARRALAVLQPLGITAEGLIATAHRMAMARDALGRTAADLARVAVTAEAGDLVIARAPFIAAPFEIQARLLAQALIFVASADYRPRWSALTAAHGAMIAGKGATLHGCMILPAKGAFRILREPAAVQATVAAPGEIWDGRWRLTGPQDKGLTLRALGEAGLALCPGWRETGHPRPSLLGSPAVWQGGRLVAAPLAGRPEGWVASVTRSLDDFIASLIVH